MKPTPGPENGAASYTPWTVCNSRVCGTASTAIRPNSLSPGTALVPNPVSLLENPMKFLTVLVALFALTFATTTYADISVSGEGTVSVTPDMASISLAVVTENSVVATAMTKNNDAANRLYDCLADFKIEKKDIQTTDFSVREG